MMFHLHVTMTFCILLVCIACMYYVLRALRKIGAKPIGLPSLNKVFTYLLTYLQAFYRLMTTDNLVKHGFLRP